MRATVKKISPNYALAKKRLLELLASGDYSVGDPLPSVNKLITILKIGRMSVQQAAAQLSREGVLETIPRNGCYVRSLGLKSDGTDQWGSTASRRMEHVGSISGGGHRKAISVELSSRSSNFLKLWERISAEYSEAQGDVRLELAQNTPTRLLDRAVRAPVDLMEVPSFQIPWLVEAGALFDLREIGGLGITPC